MNDYVNNIEPENTKYSLFQSHSRSCTAMETEVEIINFIPSFKGVSSFQLCSFDDEKEKCISPQFLCVASDSSYISINLRTNATTELLRSVKEPVRNYIAYFTQNEFIVSGPGSLGIIVDANGVSHRAPLQLSSNIVEVFVWKNYFFTITDEFFTIHNILTQSQIQTINLQKPSVACFSADAHLLYFTETSDFNTDTASIRNIQVLGPERWDLIARRFILTGCLKQAFHVQQQERNRLTQVMQLQVEKFKHEQQLFDRRRQRVLGLLGFYHFEKGELDKAASYFEQSTIDIREILFRYSDLLPKGCYFMPNWFYKLHQTNPEPSHDNNNGDTQISGINLTSDLCILRAAEDSDNDDHDLTISSSWLLRYQEFLFNFLRKHHKSKFVEKHLHFVETALVKLYVRLQQAGIQPYLYELIIDTTSSSDSRSGESGLTKSTSNSDQSLVDLISSLIHIDVEDLTVYLENNNAYHALALIYRWQGNLSGALEIWRKLVYNELNDSSFPGVEFYISILLDLSAHDPTDSQKQSPYKGVAIHSSSDVNYEFSVYAELVWNHFMQALRTNHEIIAEQLMLRFPIPSSYINSSCELSIISDSTTETSLESSLGPSQILSPNHIIQSLISSYPNMTMTYLKHLCYSLPNCHPENHNLLGKLYLNTLLMKLKSTDNLFDDDMKKRIRELRTEFCQLIRYSLLISHKTLLDRLHNESVAVQKKLAYEIAILEGKANNHMKALKYLIEDINDYKAALYYCLTFSRQQPIHYSARKNDTNVQCNTIAVNSLDNCHYWDQFEFMEGDSNNQSIFSLLFTTFVEICLDRLLINEENSNDDIKKMILNLLNNPDLKFNYSKVGYQSNKVPILILILYTSGFTDPTAVTNSTLLTLLFRLPSTWDILEIKPFLHNALRSTLHEWSELQLEYGLTKYNAKLSVVDLPKKSNCLLIEDDTLCSICHQSIYVYGPSDSFAWLIPKNQVVHTHCLSSNQ
ncbi:putative tgf beta receptor associated protein-1 [Schistosoma mansoni]|uniref:putative tgf beta receptor associated protein-1 n=1 Tax=Schistosoma mansoni TaxID=6183 RepID=UPI00019B3500|nr:putative tgf beta receptor associated protein-1 [Schistosoma mansoni]|eukprot:XP_018651222.1 putative tgf beta receptor associated protein-1 [Schistosoma mansoni]